MEDNKKTFEFSEDELFILRNGILALIDKSNKAFQLACFYSTKNAINEEYKQLKALLDKIVSESIQT